MSKNNWDDSEEILGGPVLGSSLPCTCGREHRILTHRVVIEEGVARRIPRMLPDLIPGERVLLMADTRTWEAAGEGLFNELSTTHAVERCVIPDDDSGHIHASVELADEIDASFPAAHDLIAAVGSGTVNDLAKEVAHRRGLPYFVYATAASMNGYTSAIVALLEGGLKTTRATTPPVAVFADPEVLVRAPHELTLAGLGDLVSKPFCGCDWLIASLVKSEYYCPMPNRLLSVPFERALGVFPRLAGNDPEAVLELFRLLLVSGISMSITGTSSPASGGEHLISHYWDMVRLRDGLDLNLHGAQVGVGSLVSDDLYREIFDLDFSRATFKPNPSLESERRKIRAIFGSLADAVWPQWKAKLADRENDLERLVEHEGAIKDEIARTMTTGSEVRRALVESGAPVAAQQLGLSASEIDAAIRHGRKIRTRFTVLDVAAELGSLDSFADRISGP